MSKGLGVVQRSLLRLAQQHAATATADERYYNADVYEREAAIAAFHPELVGTLTTPEGRRRAHTPTRPGQGLPTTGAQEATVSRAARTLITRGYLTKHWTGRGWSITPAGSEWCRHTNVAPARADLVDR